MTYAKRFFLALIVTAASVFAHEQLTHQNIGDAALDFLDAMLPARASLGGSSLAAGQLLRKGAFHEDDPFFQTGSSLIDSTIPWGRFFFHFNPPLDGTLFGATLSANGCSSSIWAFIDTSCTLTAGIVLTESNSYRWDQDLAADSNGAPTNDAVTGFGYVVHLLEDLGSPAHTRNDLHPCPFGTFIGYSCDLFEKMNKDRSPILTPGWSSFLNANPVIPLSGLSTPKDYFDALRSYVLLNYYSNNTVFDGQGPLPVTLSPQTPTDQQADATYFYGPCINAAGFQVSNEALTCSTIAGQSVRKIARKDGLYWASCVAGGCLPPLAEIDQTIAQEQFDELGPVIAQHVAAFIMFYAPALNVVIKGTGTVTSSPGTRYQLQQRHVFGAVRSRGERHVDCKTCFGINGDMEWRMFRHSHIRHYYDDE